jgi:hypothetical protein
MISILCVFEFDQDRLGLELSGSAELDILYGTVQKRHLRKQKESLADWQE